MSKPTLSCTEREALADKLKDVWEVLRYVAPRNLPADLAGKFDGSYADAVLDAAQYIRPTGGARS